MKLIFILIIISFNLFAINVLDKCQIINSSGNYALEQNLNLQIPYSHISIPYAPGVMAGTCFFFNSSDVLFDCNGYKIYGDTGFDAEFLSLSPLENLTIKNCIVSKSSAIHIQNGSKILIENMQLLDVAGGIGIENSENVHLENVTFIRTNGALNIKNSKKVILSYTKAFDCYKSFTIDASDLTIENSEVVNSSEGGFYIVPTSGRLSNIVIKNTKSNFNKEGFRIMSADNVVFENNEAKNNSNEGVIFETSNNVQISNLDASGNSAGLRLTGPLEDVKLSKINTSNNKYLGLSTFLIKKLEMESIFACSNKLNDTSIRESDYSKSNIICDKSNPETFCDVKCSSTIQDGSNSKNDKNCIGALLLASILFLVFKRG